MVKKKRGHPDLEELLARPWCYYCERDFDDLKILISHQKAKHFKCERCGRRLNTAGGLSVHMSQVHKEQLSAVDNALPNRSSLDIEIFGMEGVPEDIIQSHNQRVITQFQQAEMERRAATGNPPPGASKDGSQAKKPKLELSDLKKRIAEHKAKLADQAAGGSSGEATPVGAGQTTQVGGAVPTQQPYNVSGSPAQQPSYPQPYGGTNSPYPQAASPGFQGVSPNGQHQFTPSQYASPPQYQVASVGQPPVSYSNMPPHLPFAPHQQPNRTHTPPQGVSPYPQRPAGLPVAPGLPQRPTFGAPQANTQQMQQIHHGLTPPNIPSLGYNALGYPTPIAENGDLSKPHISTAVSSSVDELISGAAKAADNAAAGATPVPQSNKAEEKTSKKEKDKSKARLVYSDNETSPEEKMAKLPRYAFVPDHRENVALGDATVPAVARATTGSDYVADPAD